jgi:4-amino-4-deoxy-L-arabinose transferase-like glycosyltransferase
VSAFVARLPRVPHAVRLPLVAETSALAAIVAVAAYVYTRDLHTYPNFDEGNYLGSLDALRHGQALGRDVFLDQPPGWYLLLIAVSYPFGNSVSGVRTGLMVVTLVAILAAYVCGRLAAGPLAGLAAAAVMAVARPLPGFAGLVESEPASAALAAAAVALAIYAYHRRFRPWAAFAAGVVLAASTAVKLPGATAGLPIAALAILCGSGPLLRRLLLPVAGAAVVCVALVLAYRHALPQIWHGVFVAHTRILGSTTAVSNVHRAATYVDPRTPFGCLVIGGALASLVVAVRGRDRRLLAALWLWSVAGYGFVLAMHPLNDHHLVFLAVSLALPAGVGLGLLATHASLQRLAVAALMLVIAAFFAAGVVKDRSEIIGANAPEPPEIRWAVSQIRTHTPPGQLVVSDLPIVPYLAGRQMPGQLIDTSIGRIALEDLPPRDVLRLIDQTRPYAAIIGRMFQTKPAIVAGIRSRYARRLHYQLAGAGYLDVFLDRR